VHGLTAVRQETAASAAVFGLPGFHFRLVSEDWELEDRFRLVFGELEGEAGLASNPHVYEVVCPSDATRTVLFDGEPIVEVVPLSSAFAFLEWHVTRHCLQHTDDGIALHAGAVERDGRAILLSGSSGSGKTTIALSLLSRGAHYLSDEAVFVSSDGRVRGLPRALALKAGRSHWIDLPFGGHRDATTHCEADGTTYVAPRALGFEVVGRRVEPGAVVLLQRTETEAGLSRLTAGEAFLPLLQQVFSNEPHEDILATVSSLLRRAPVYRLSGSDIVETTSLVEGLFETPTL